MPTCKRTQRRDNRFFDALEAGFGVGESARRAGYSRRSTYDYRDQDADFAKRWEEAIESHVEALEIEADRRASVGVEEPVFYKGKECGRIRKYSDNLLMFRLKALAPEKYRERRELTGKDGGPIETAVSFTCMVLEAVDGQTRSK